MMKKLNMILIKIANLTSKSLNAGNSVNYQYQECVDNIKNANISNTKKQRLLNIAYKKCKKILKYQIKANIGSKAVSDNIWSSILADAYYSIYEISSKLEEEKICL